MSVKCRDGWKLYACPSLDRISEHVLRWHVYVECVPPEGSSFFMSTHRFEKGQENEILALVRARL